MRNKEDMDCFKWHENDRICYVCVHEEECIYEFALYNFIDSFQCEYKEQYYGCSFAICTKNETEGEYVQRHKQEFCIGIKECKAKEIENFKRKYKLERLNKKNI